MPSTLPSTLPSTRMCDVARRGGGVAPAVTPPVASTSVSQGRLRLRDRQTTDRDPLELAFVAAAEGWYIRWAGVRIAGPFPNISDAIRAWRQRSGR